MKILELIGNSKYGGATEVVLNISNTLKEDGMDVYVMANDETTQEVFRKNGHKVYKIDTMCREIKFFRDLLSVWKLRKFVKQKKIDVIHSHTSKGGAYSRFVKLLCRVKVIHTVHGFAFDYDYTLKDRFFMTIEKILARWSDMITFVNQKDFQYAKKNFKRPKLRLIFNGIEEEKFNKKDIEKEKIYIGIVARVVKEKGYDTYLEMVEALKKESNVKFYIVGTGPEETFYKELIKQKELENHIDYLGFISNVNEVIGEWDIFVLPSWREGLSISILEAMASKLCCVVSNIRGNDELIENGYNGFLFDALDTKELVKKVRILLNDPTLRKNMGENARKTVEEKFTKTKMLENYREVFREIQR